MVTPNQRVKVNLAHLTIQGVPFSESPKRTSNAPGGMLPPQPVGVRPPW